MSKTRKPAFVALGDVHLDHFIWKRIPAVTGDAFLAYAEFIQHAERLKVPAVIVGDLFDVIKPDSKIIQFHRRLMDRCAEAKTPVYFIQGNHDKQAAPWACAVHDHAVWVGDGKSFKIGSLTCKGWDYDLHDVMQAKVADFLQEKENCDVLFIHQAVKQSLPFDGAWNFDLDWIVRADTARLVVMGDIHKPETHKMSNGNTALYTGVSHARDIDQTCDKSCVLVYDDLTWERLPITTRPIARFVVNDDLGLLAVNAWLASHKALGCVLKPFAWIMFTPPMADAVKAINSPESILHLDPVASVDEAMAIQEETTDESAVSTADLLAKLIDKEANPDDYQFASKVCMSTDDLMQLIVAQREKVMSNEA